MADKSKESKVVDVVAQDKDWRGVIENELKFQENWQKDWGFLAQEYNTDKAITKKEKVQLLEEKLKKMEDVKIQSEFKSKYRGNDIDMQIKQHNKRKENELLPQSRRPKAISEAHKRLVEARGDNYEVEPYDNFLGAK
mmetsp:Transcript_15778/g.16376  ORF Transcript_15778/g.16376 Transcript_15778/m.16376 type:complete len:138 (+) Transcript_15778:21-434(+)